MNKPLLRRIRHAIQNWWRCRTQRCDYYRHYLAYGPADLTHVGYHSAERISSEHFKNCRYEGDGLCRICTSWEQRLRA